MATVTLLQLKSDFWDHQGELFSSTATAGGTGKLTDTTLTDLPSETYPTPIAGRQIRITSTITDLRRAVRFDDVAGDIVPNRPFSSAISTNTYELWGSSINGGVPLTNLFNAVLRRMRVITQTQITVVTNQTIYDISAQVASPVDVLEVYRRLIDPASLRPYTPMPLMWWDAYMLAGAGTASVPTLEIDAPFSSTDTNQQLWLEHRKQFTAFSTTVDTGTVDATYRDLIVWEAIYEHTARLAEQSTGDKGAWRERQARAASELRMLRPRYAPRRPIRLRPSRPG